jgi:hypothetical protein
MFRTTMIRSSAATARVALRPAAAARRTPITAAAAPSSRAALLPKIQSFAAVRMYSAGGSLSKEAVEGRIISLLQGFDKVSHTYSIPVLYTPVSFLASRSLAAFPHECSKLASALLGYQEYVPEF